MADRLPRPGETIIGYGFGCSTGGKGANQAVAAARLGAEVCMVGCLGRDMNGDVIMSEYKTYGINAEYVTRLPDTPTSTCLIHIEKGGENAIIIDIEANQRLSLEHVDNARGLLSRTNVLLVQNEIPIETTIHAVTIAKEAGALVIYNPAPADPLSEKLFNMIDYFTPNEIETEFYAGVKGESNIEKAAEILLKKGIKNVIITLGKNGAYYAGKDFHARFPAFHVTAVDATAAGDAFNGALAVMLNEGKNIKDAIKFANAAGAICARGAGSQISMGDRAAVERLMSEQK